MENSKQTADKRLYLRIKSADLERFKQAAAKSNRKLSDWARLAMDQEAKKQSAA